jgi:hypothetical protein
VEMPAGHRARAPGAQGQAGLGPIQCLALCLLIKAEHDRPLRWVHVEADHIDQLLLESGVVGDFEGLDLPRLQVVVVPDAGDRVLADPDLGGEPTRSPVGGTIVRLLVLGQPQDLGHRPGWERCRGAAGAMPGVNGPECDDDSAPRSQSLQRLDLLVDDALLLPCGLD